MYIWWWYMIFVCNDVGLRFTNFHWLITCLVISCPWDCFAAGNSFVINAAISACKSAQQWPLGWQHEGAGWKIIDGIPGIYLLIYWNGNRRCIHPWKESVVKLESMIYHEFMTFITDLLAGPEMETRNWDVMPKHGWELSSALVEFSNLERAFGQAKLGTPQASGFLK